jgi:hypothetical protein
MNQNRLLVLNQIIHKHLLCEQFLLTVKSGFEFREILYIFLPCCILILPTDLLHVCRLRVLSLRLNTRSVNDLFQELNLLISSSFLFRRI